MKKFAIYCIDFYRALISPVMEAVFGKACRHEVTCSQYAREVISDQGLLRGGFLSIRRVVSCR